MIPRQNRFSGISLSPPEPITANFGAPAPMSMPAVPQMEDTDPYAGLRQAGHQFQQGQMQRHVGQLQDKFTGHNAPLSTPQGDSGMTLSRPPAGQRFAGSLDALKSALKGVF